MPETLCKEIEGVFIVTKTDNSQEIDEGKSGLFTIRMIFDNNLLGYGDIFYHPSRKMMIILPIIMRQDYTRFGAKAKIVQNALSLANKYDCEKLIGIVSRTDMLENFSYLNRPQDKMVSKGWELRLDTIEPIECSDCPNNFSQQLFTVNHQNKKIGFFSLSEDEEDLSSLTQYCLANQVCRVIFLGRELKAVESSYFKGLLSGKLDHIYTLYEFSHPQPE